jgi:hypothetical protein
MLRNVDMTQKKKNQDFFVLLTTFRTFVPKF